MTVTFVLLIVGLALLVFGADLLVRGGGQLALALRIPVLVVGLTIVAFGTSMPELSVSVLAALRASTDMALANVTGSNIANISIVLGLAAMARPLEVQRDLIRREVPTCVLLQALVPVLLFDGTLSRLDGFVLLATGVIYNVFLVYAAFRGRVELSDDDELTAEGSWSYNLVLLIVGVVILLVGAESFVRGATELAKAAGLSQRYVGLTVVALGTSAPEMMTGVVSAWRGQVDLAVGNSLGSNILNVALVLGGTAMISPIHVHDDGAWRDMMVALLVTMLLVPFVLRGKGLSRIEGGLLAGAYLTYILTLPTT